MAEISELARAQFEFKKEKDNQYKIEKGLEKKQFRMRKRSDQILPPDELVDEYETPGKGRFGLNQAVAVSVLIIDAREKSDPSDRCDVSQKQLC